MKRTKLSKIQSSLFDLETEFSNKLLQTRRRLNLSFASRREQLANVVYGLGQKMAQMHKVG